MPQTLFRPFLRCVIAAVLVFSSTASFAADATDKDDDSSPEDAVNLCLKAWGTHPFGHKPKYKTMATSVKVFGIGKNPKDAEVTAKPELILVNPAVNVMGGTVFELLNPNGWYCFRANVNVMGGLVVKAHCKAHLASASNGATVMGTTDSANKGVTVMGSTKVELIDCGK
jgi:hypothetical protein